MSPIFVIQSHNFRGSWRATVPGNGVIDFKPILQVLSDHNYEGWLMVEAEQDHRKANPLEYALKARSYLREVTGL